MCDYQVSNSFFCFFFGYSLLLSKPTFNDLFKNDLYCLFVSSSALAGSTEAPLVVSINVVEPGEDVTLTSPCHSKIFHWYKQRLGYTMDTVALNVDNRESSKRTNDSRITVSTGKDCTLTIRNVSKDDEATYFCFSGTMFRPSFASGIFLAVTGKISSFYCFLNTRGYHKYEHHFPHFHVLKNVNIIQQYLLKIQ